jgi:hypothetical protein
MMEESVSLFIHKDCTVSHLKRDQSKNLPCREAIRPYAVSMIMNMLLLLMRVLGAATTTTKATTTTVRPAQLH